MTAVRRIVNFDLVGGILRADDAEKCDSVDDD